MCDWEVAGGSYTSGAHLTQFLNAKSLFLTTTFHSRDELQRNLRRVNRDDTDEKNKSANEKRKTENFTSLNPETTLEVS